jgi:hypothetical protein
MTSEQSGRSSESDSIKLIWASNNLTLAFAVSRPDVQCVMAILTFSASGQPTTYEGQSLEPADNFSSDIDALALACSRTSALLPLLTPIFIGVLLLVE